MTDRCPDCGALVLQVVTITGTFLVDLYPRAGGTWMIREMHPGVYSGVRGREGLLWDRHECRKGERQ